MRKIVQLYRDEVLSGKITIEEVPSQLKTEVQAEVDKITQGN